MENYIIKFKFLTPVHFGDIEQRSNLSSTDFLLQSDSVFSALCNEAFKLYGQKGVDRLLDIANGDFELSSMLPFYNDNYFLPKPLVVYNYNNNASYEKDSDMNYKKKLKKLKFLKISNFSYYNECGLNNKNIDVDKLINDTQNFGVFSVVQKVKTSRVGEDSLPYHLGVFTYNENSGAYVVLRIGNKDDIDFISNLFAGLTFSGLGGRRSSGYGKFSYEIIELCNTRNNDLEILNKLLNMKSKRYMTLSLFLPSVLDDEFLKNSYYTLVRRSGFIDSANFSDTFVKKSDVYTFGVGSTFNSKVEGQILNVAGNFGNHKVYKFLKPLYVGVDSNENL